MIRFPTNFLSIIKTPISYIGWFIVSLTFTLICIPLTLFPAPWRYTNRLYFLITAIWSKLLVFFSFTHIKIRGEENLPKYPDSPAIIVTNHTSALDIFLIEILAGTYPHIWLTKHEYTKIPLFSVLLNRMHVPVKRKNSLAAAKSLIKAFYMAKDISSHILIFPEGTRHDDGKIHDFHPGFAMLAKKLNRPIIPIKTFGLHKIFPKGKIFINYNASQPSAIIGKPMYSKEDESVEDFCRRVQQWFESHELNKPV